MNMIDNKIMYHNHGGYYNDGNSHYYSISSILDLTAKTFNTIRTDEYGGQLAGPSQFSHKEETETETVPAIPFTPKQENDIYNTLLPLIETAEKYPSMTNFRFFSMKHRYFIEGRANKAIKLALKTGSHYFGVNCLRNIWILPAYNKIITFYSHYKESNWSITVNNIL